MAPFVSGQLRYSDEVVFHILGTPDAVEELVGSNTRGAGDVPITVSVESEGDWKAEEPGENFWNDLQALQDSLAAPRGGGVPDLEEGYLLPPGLNPYLDELPDWLQVNLVRPIPGLLDGAALLPAEMVERWNLAAGNLDTLFEILDRFFEAELNISSTRSSVGAARSAAVQKVDGFRAVGVVDTGLGCRRYSFEDQGNAAIRFLHYYTFPASSTPSNIRIAIKQGKGRLAVDNAAVSTIRGPVETQAISEWHATVDPSEITKAIGVYIRNVSNVANCTYDLVSACQAIGADIAPGGG